MNLLFYPLRYRYASPSTIAFGALSPLRERSMPDSRRKCLHVARLAVIDSTQLPYTWQRFGGRQSDAHSSPTLSLELASSLAREIRSMQLLQLKTTPTTK